MVRKKIDNRIRVLIENGVKLGHRTLFAIVGDKGRDQVLESLLLVRIFSH
jgi:N-acetyltransferase 10